MIRREIQWLQDNCEALLQYVVSESLRVLLTFGLMLVLTLLPCLPVETRWIRSWKQKMAKCHLWRMRWNLFSCWKVNSPWFPTTVDINAGCFQILRWEKKSVNSNPLKSICITENKLGLVLHRECSLWSFQIRFFKLCFIF